MSRQIPASIEYIARGLATARGQILVCRSRKHGHAYLPGGHVERGETAAEALAREFLEETGQRVVVGPFLFANENLFLERGTPRQEITVLFHVEHAAGTWPEEVPSMEEKLAVEWADPASLPEAGFLPPVQLAWLMAGGPGGDLHRHESAWASDPRLA